MAIAGRQDSFGDHYRAEGDRSRDKGHWSEAASHYRKYLAVRPDDFGIWVQLGHAFKEDRVLDEAEAAYGNAYRLNPKDDDLLLNLGHLNRLAGEFAAAAKFYRLSVEAGQNQHAARELASPDLRYYLGDAERAVLEALMPETTALKRRERSRSADSQSAAIRSVITHAAEDIYSVDPKIIAFYLPQYHPVKENDEWWGEGFTEWINVKKAKPNFVGHDQPRVPENQHYYDLSDPQVQRNQAKIAKEFGITAFCYYLYWFDGRRILELPLDQMLADKSIDHEFCVCWANENWTRTWDGKASDILLEQVHSDDSDRRFIHDNMKYLRDPRYMRVDGKLVLLVYRVDLIPNCRETAEIWREEVRKAGLGELHLCAVQFYGITDPAPWGFDAAVEFPPHGWLVQENLPDHKLKMLNKNFKGQIFDYGKAVDWALSKSIPDYRWYRGVFPGWDNTARRQDTSHIFADSSHIKFEYWLTEVLRQTVTMAPPEHQVVFVNAWNEWGEGAHLEPDDKNGQLNLMALNSALKTARQEAWPLSVLGRLRQAGDYPGRSTDERALLAHLLGQEQSLATLAAQLRATGVNPFEVRRA
jgi:tetratricopeptide (TPR) repeat protein